MNRERQAELEDTVRSFRRLLPYFKDWEAWQSEIRRLEGNIVKLRKHRYTRLARTLEESLPRLKSVLSEEKTEHAFTVNKLVAELNRLERRNKARSRRKTLNRAVECRG
jgi:hypothetical protein